MLRSPEEEGLELSMKKSHTKYRSAFTLVEINPLGRLGGGSTQSVNFTAGGDTVVVTVSPTGRITVQ